MRGSRARLINAARRSMIQRAELRRKLGIAQSEFKPAALVGRGKARVSAKVDDTAHAVRQQFRDNRLPIAIAAAAGLAWLFREPIKEHAPRLGRKIKDLADGIAERFHPSDAEGTGAEEVDAEAADFDGDFTDEQDQIEEDDDEALR